ncbi:hypothetical protein [Paenibacillus taichungensis]|uniref:hypothetical protein n=1 Tax=Paenibacillus taichungensis TaxID=484184 RepID=UPI0039A39EFA
MSENQIKEVSLEQKCKNLEYQNENILRVLQATNESLTILYKSLNSTNEYTVCRQVNSLNTQLVDITSKIIQSDHHDNQLLIKQAFLTGQIQALNQYSNSITETANKLNSLISSTRNPI